MTPIYLGFSGLMGVGKTTLARMVADNLFYPGDVGTRILPFAEPVKAIARQMGWDGVKDARGRRLLQLIGTECGRECIGPDVWVDAWKREADAIVEYVRRSAPRALVVIVADDVRFPNEASTVREHGLVYEVKRSRMNDGTACDHVVQHVSERGIEGDHVIVNDGSLADLRTHAVAIAADINPFIKRVASKGGTHAKGL